jgi:hypothetical protein
MKIGYSDIISTIALLVSLVVGIVVIFQFTDEFLKPEVKVKLEEYQLKRTTPTSYEFSAKIQFAITNRSSRPIYLSGCKFENESVIQGRGGWETKWTDCPIFKKDYTTNEGVEVKARQTRFFSDTYQLEITDISKNDNDKFEQPDLEKALLRMGMALDDNWGKIFSHGRDSCSVSYKLRPESVSAGGNCGISYNAKLFTLIIQLSNGDFLKVRVNSDFVQDWPWETNLQR